ncbi:MAG: pirin family protein [Nitrospinota bacterium]
MHPADRRGRTQLGWLDSRHSFSFGEYRDPENPGFCKLRVINDDRVAPGGGFGTHSHGDMEIVTLVLEGSLAHKDNLGSVSILKPGDVQVMSAGSGITHSEYNGSEDEPVWFFQIWIDPDREGLEPSYAERSFPEEGQLGKLTLLAAREGAGGALPVHQDIRLFTAVLEPETPVEYALAPDRHAWLQVARETVALNGQILTEGDGASVSEEETLEIAPIESARIFLFDLA